MKKLLFSAAALLVTSATFAQTWTVDKSHSKVGFAITHMMLTEVDGNFKTFDAKLTGKPDMSDAQFEMTADVNSINTDNERRDGHLKSADWFDAAKFGTVSFKSTSFKKVSGNKYKMTGDLTMHGVTKPVTLDATVLGPVVNKNREGKEITKVGLKTSGQIKRSDFGVGGNGPMSPVSDEVDLRVNGEFAMQ
ncbi:MAG: polyisoprenoid-binding protein [Cytophagales bacterium]|nr:MAG: polyisoprenoid-binding protein [Cytophagales bacterium]